jgi:hypothetical protein
MTLVIATMRSSLQASTSSVGNQFVPFIYKRRDAFGSPYEDSNSRSSISSSMVVERKSRSRGNESASYVVPDDAITYILSAI